MFGYRVPDPDEAMLISGGNAGADGTPFRVIKGRGAFVLPFFRHASFLTLAMQEALIDEVCVTQQGISVNVKAVCAFKVGNEDESVVNAATRFLSDENQMALLTGRIFAGHLRAIIGAMTVEEIVRERQKLAVAVLDASTAEVAKLGLLIDSFQISSIDDQGSGYIESMAAPHRAAVQRDAKVAQAEANRISAEAEQESQSKQSEYARETQIVQAKNKADVDKQTAQAEQAGPLAHAQAQQEVTAQQTVLAQKNAELREQQLKAEVIKPAEADAEKVRLMAKAEADATAVKAQAAAQNDRVSLDQLMIEQLPTIVQNAAMGLAGANVNILEGADGVGKLLAGLIGQGQTMFDAARQMHAETNGNRNGKPAEVTPV